MNSKKRSGNYGSTLTKKKKTNARTQLDYTRIITRGYSSFKGVSSDHRIVTAKMCQSLLWNKKEIKTWRYDGSSLTSRDIKKTNIMYLLGTQLMLFRKYLKDIHWMTKAKTFSMSAWRQQQNVLEPNQEPNVEFY